MMREAEEIGPARAQPSHLKPIGHETLFAFLIAVAVVLLASGVNFLRYHGYPLWRPESAIAAAVLLAVGLVFSVLYVWRNIYWRALLQTFLIFLAFDLNSDNLPVALVSGLAVFAVLVWKKSSLLQPLSIMASFVLLMGLAGLGETQPFLESSHGAQRSTAGNRPAILHLLLDEHIGVEGLPSGDTSAQLASAELKRTYTAMGFRVYGRAYSRHFHTVNAIPWIFNLGQPASSVSSGRDGVRVGPNVYFRRLAQLGYRTKILQSEFADLCTDSRYETCTTYFQNSLPLLDRHPFATTERAKLIFFKFIALSTAIRSSARNFDRVAPRSGLNVPRLAVGQRARSSSIGGLAAMDLLADELTRARPGDAFIAHILLPHHPYAFRRDCSAWPSKPLIGRSSFEPIERKRFLYYEQVRCTTRKVGEAVAALERSAARNDFVVIVHGDHGSRITVRDPTIRNLEKFEPHDMIAGFSTLFAVRGSGISPGYEDAPAPVATLLRQLVNGNFRSPPAPQPPGTSLSVFLDDSDWRPRRSANLPSQWVSLPVPERDRRPSRVP